MGAQLFDVFVEGSRDTSETGKTQLAGAIAARYKLPDTQIVQALARGRFRVGKSLDQATADRLANQLEGIGAIVAVLSVGGAPAATAPNFPQMPSTAGASLPAPGGTIPGAGGATMPGQGIATAPAGFGNTGPGYAPAPGGPPSAAAAQGNAYLPANFGPPVDVNGPGQSSAPPGGARDPFSAPSEGDSLELAGPSRGTQAGAGTGSGGSGGYGAEGGTSGGFFSLPQHAGARPATSAGTFGDARLPTVSGAPPLTATTSVPAGLDDDDDVAAGAARPSKLTRCAEHGLLYDPTRTDGCRKCLGPVAASVISARQGPLGVLYLGDLKVNQMKRAFVGLALALFIGFIPVALYARGINATDVENLRHEQELLSKKVGTEDVRSRYDKLDKKVYEVRSSGAWKSFGLWVVLTGGLMAGWYKLT